MAHLSVHPNNYSPFFPSLKMVTFVFKEFTIHSLQTNITTHMRFPQILLLCILFTILISSCERDGIGGTSNVEFQVLHQTIEIPYAKVYIKYGAKESPGTDVNLYDDSTQTGASGHGFIQDLLKGDYYLYAVGYDSILGDTVTGGLSMKLTKNGQQVETVIRVSE
jgi:hypothetical protein